MILNRKRVQNLDILTIGPFDVYNSIDSRIYFKKILNNLFQMDDQLFCYVRREEDLTNESELIALKESIFGQMGGLNEFRYLKKIDYRRFDGIVKLNLKFDFSNLILDMWKYFYSYTFFAPINNLSFDEYEDYLLTVGVNDLNGITLVNNQLAKFICIKGLGADHLIITSTIEINGQIMQSV